MNDIAPVEQAHATLGSEREALGLEKDPALAATIDEAAVLLLFSRHFGLADLGVNDSFFLLGGDSLQAASLMTQIEHDFGIVFSVSVMLDAETPRKLAALITQTMNSDSAADCLVAVRPSGEGPPVFCIHTFAGDVAYARALAAALGPGRPVYGMRAFGLQSNEVPIPTLNGIVRHYLSEIRRVQPHGPYLLVGGCHGSIIASEMARLLCQAGEEVPGLVMIDPIPLVPYSPWLASSSIVSSIHRARGAFRVVRSQLIARSHATSGGQRRRLVSKSLKGVIAVHQPLPYDGSVLLFYSEEYRDGLLNNKRFLNLYPQMRTAPAGEKHGSGLRHGLEEVGRTISNYFDEVSPLTGTASQPEPPVAVAAKHARRAASKSHSEQELSARE